MVKEEEVMGRLPGEVVVSVPRSFLGDWLYASAMLHNSGTCFKAEGELLVFAPCLHLCFAKSIC